MATIAVIICPLFQVYNIFDSIDQHVEVANVRYSDISKAEPGEASEKRRERVIKARKIQE